MTMTSWTRTTFAILADYLTDDHDVVYTRGRGSPPSTDDLSEDGLQIVMPLPTLRVANFIASAAAVQSVDVA